jgi:Sec-independent protein secretion pathway component TatC
LRSIVAVVVVLVCLFPFAKEIYALLAAPLLHTLPQGATMIATDVTGTFLVPLKVTLMRPTSVWSNRISPRACKPAGDPSGML